MRAKVFFEITQGGEEFTAVVAVEGFSIMQSKMSSKPVSSVESFCTSALVAFERLNL